MEGFVKIGLVISAHSSAQNDTQTHRHTDTQTHTHRHLPTFPALNVKISQSRQIQTN